MCLHFQRKLYVIYCQTTNEINFHLAEEATNFMLKFFLLCFFFFFAHCISFDFTCYLNVEPKLFREL